MSSRYNIPFMVSLLQKFRKYYRGGKLKKLHGSGRCAMISSKYEEEKS
ncbi:hypothetical protein CLOSTHATH_00567 [Hungatella hathewayi DSM 13479]|uniref:Uncharacterized protein n=1 Tax=Hungatella hathewayi DSM 13479 TaxID=566550 RepID=D3AAE6_9FIRM|nr:hypothetical protein CLOSTHATH_00567 [Hungatella hathewayi DSM 13479]